MPRKKAQKQDGKTVTQYFDENGNVKKTTTEENGVTTITEYDENGNVTSTIRKKGAVVEYIEDGKVTKKETDKGGGLKETIEYVEAGNISKTTITKADGSQVIEDGWSGKTADAISILWGSENRAVKVRADIERYKVQLEELSEAVSQGEEIFKAKFKEIFGVEYNSENINAYMQDPTDENYAKAYGTKNNIAKRVAVYNKSQQKGAQTVKGAVVAAGQWRQLQPEVRH